MTCRTLGSGAASLTDWIAEAKPALPQGFGNSNISNTLDALETQKRLRLQQSSTVHAGFASQDQRGSYHLG
jgi:hypothetical protein